jgi:hypothetical protein
MSSFYIKFPILVLNSYYLSEEAKYIFCAPDMLLFYIWKVWRSDTTQFEEPALSSISVNPISEVCTSTVRVLLKVESWKE